MNPTHRSSLLLLLAGALALAACGGSSMSSAGSGTPTPPSGAATAKDTRGAITAVNPVAHTITVNNKTIAVQGATIVDDTVHVGEDRLAMGTVVSVRGDFADDRTGTAAHVEIEHGLVGRVDDRGTDSIRVGGQVVHVDDTTHFDDSRRLAGIAAGPTGTGTVVRVSGVPDDRGGLRASRIDRSTVSDDSFEVKGFVSSLSGSSFQLRLSPDSVAYWIVDASGVTLPAGVADGAFVEVHALSSPAAGTAPVLGTITASRVELEDRFGESEVEVEGIVTSGSSAEFVVDGTTVTTSSSTRWELGTPADLVPGVKVEAEGSLDASGVLVAEKVSFRPGARLTAMIDSVASDGSSITMLGMRVQTPTFMDDDFGPLVAGARVEVRGNPSADGSGLVASRVTDPGGNRTDTRVLLRAVVTDKSNANAAAPTFTLMGFTVTTAGAQFLPSSGQSGLDAPAITAAAFYDLVQPGSTVIKVRARTASDVSVANHTFAADELEIEGNDG
jgi:uncharacterized protein DUF5666